MFDVSRVRADFPILSRVMPSGKPLVYFDNAATTQKPSSVIGAVDGYYRESNANAHRGIHTLSIEATEAYEGARARVAGFVGGKPGELVFTRGTTESINLVAYSWGRANLKKGDVVLLSQMEHHSNLVPWQAIAAERGAKLRFIPVTVAGELDLSGLDALLEGVKLVAVTQASNVLGTINDVSLIARKAHAAGAVVLLDGAQSVPHFPVDVGALGCDFLAFSSHKMLGPMGIGGLWGKKGLLEAMPPFNFGGEMIREVSFESATWNDVPAKFEAGTSDVGGAVGFAAAVDYLNAVGLGAVRTHELSLLSKALSELESLGGITLFGPRDVGKRTGVVSFNVDGVHAHDVASVLDGEGVAIRSGHHCAMPLMRLMGVPATSRASFYLYNSVEEVDVLLGALRKVKLLFKV